MPPSSFQSIAKLACIDEDITSADEVKVYMDEGEADSKGPEYLSEDKEGLVDQSDESVDILKPVVNSLLPPSATAHEGSTASSPELAKLAHGTSTKHNAKEIDVNGSGKGQYIGNGIRPTLPSLSYISALYNAGVSPFSMLSAGIPPMDDKGNLLSNFNFGFPNFNLNAFSNSKANDKNSEGLANPNCTYAPTYFNGLQTDFRHWPRPPYGLPTSVSTSSFPNHMMQTLGFNPMINGFPPPPLGSCSPTVPPLGFPHLGNPIHSANNPSLSFNPYNLSVIDQLRPWDIVAESKSSKPHIKKPLNAFMLFMREQREQVVKECTLKESAAINQILGRKWHELNKADQSKYYELARQERLKHTEMYPNWSARDNYGLRKKRKKRRERAPGEFGELARKCRARYGLNQIDLWCKPCRRKKKCSRFSNSDDNGSLASEGGEPNNVPSDDGEEHTNVSDDRGYHNMHADNGEFSFNPIDDSRDYNDLKTSSDKSGPMQGHASDIEANCKMKIAQHLLAQS